MQSDSASNTSMEWQHVRFEPWVGGEFGQTADARRVLVLGESHYDSKGHGVENNPRMTQDMIKAQCSGSGTRAFFTKIERLLSDPGPTSPIERAAFWSRHAFMNYLQHSVGDRHDAAPTTAMFRASSPAFWEVIARLRPHLVLVLGTSRLWRNMPDDHGWQAASEIGHPDGQGPRAQRGQYEHEGHRFMVAAIHHPSTHQFNRWGCDHWRPIVREAVRLAVSSSELT